MEGKMNFESDFSAVPQRRNPEPVMSFRWPWRMWLGQSWDERPMCEPQARARKAEDAIAVAQSVRIFPEFGHGQFFERFPWQIETRHVTTGPCGKHLGLPSLSSGASSPRLWRCPLAVPLSDTCSQSQRPGHLSQIETELLRDALPLSVGPSPSFHGFG